MSNASSGGTRTRVSHFACPFCGGAAVDRLYLASARVDSCQCPACGARWDEDSATGEYLGRADRSSVLLPRRP